MFLASKARGELSLSLSHSGLTIAIPLELARAFYYLFDFTSIRFDNEPPIRFYNCLAMASSLPFLIRREHSTKTNTSRILLFDTRRARTSKRLENKA